MEPTKTKMRLGEALAVYINLQHCKNMTVVEARAMEQAMRIIVHYAQIGIKMVEK